jgi:hypothetical protein
MACLATLLGWMVFLLLRQLLAISGLASYPFGSWKQQDELGRVSNFM